MQIEYITDKAGHKKSVVVPYREWEKLLKEMEKQRVLLGVKGAVSEVNQMLAGRKKERSLQELLDEL